MVIDRRLLYRPEHLHRGFYPPRRVYHCRGGHRLHHPHLLPRLAHRNFLIDHSRGRRRIDIRFCVVPNVGRYWGVWGLQFVVDVCAAAVELAVQEVAGGLGEAVLEQGCTGVGAEVVQGGPGGGVGV